MLEMLLVAPAFVQNAPAETARFAPPLDTTFAYVTTETRDDAGVERHFRSERRLIFHRRLDGYVAEVTLLRSKSGDSGDVGAMFSAALASLEGTPIPVQLDRSGAVTGIDDRDALWERLCDGFAAMAPAANAKRAQAIAAALRSLPADSRTAMLGSLVSSVIGGGDALLRPGDDAAVLIRTRPPSGAPIAIPATRRVSLSPDGLLDIRVDGAADLSATGDRPAAHIAIQRRRLLDRATGLVRSAEQTRRIGIATETDEVVSTTRTVTTLAPTVL